MSDVEADAGWNERARHETTTERLDRNWGDLLQELRVVQTGVQLLTGFLLTLPFQDRFAGLDSFAHNVYLTTVGCSIAATCLLIAPVSLHRALFRQHRRRTTVTVGHLLAVLGTAMLGAALVGVVLLIFDVMAGRAAGWWAAAATGVLILLLWAALPQIARTRTRPEGARQAPGPSDKASDDR